MRAAGVVLTVAIAAMPAAAPTGGLSGLARAQVDPAVRLAAAKKKSAAKAKDAARKGKAQPVPASYAAMPLAERAAIQFDLNWTGHFAGLADGDFNDRAVAAVKAFQKDRGFRETGVLSESERTALAEAAQSRRERVGWQPAEDRATGARLWIPTKQAPHQSSAGSGTRWQSAQGQLQIQTFRIREPGATLAVVFEDQKKQPPSRRVEASALRSNSFTLSGMQGLKRFLVQAEIRDLEIRGVTILYDQAIESTTTHVAYGVASAFAPFVGSGVMALIGPPARSKVEYGTGITVTGDGHLVTDRRLTEDCAVLQVAGHGDAARIAAQNEVALLRVFGAGPLVPAALVHQGARASTLTLVGIADPRAQDGLRAASAVPARFEGESLQPAPPLGFAGAAALGEQGRIYGMVTLKAPPPADGGNLLPAATVTPVDAIRRLLDAYYVTPATGSGGVEAAKASVVRIICVRR